MQKNIIAGLGKAIQFAIWGAVGGAIGALLSEPTHSLREQSSFDSLTESIIWVGIWFGIIGAAIAVTLLIASSQYLKRGLQLPQALKGGIWVGFLAGAIAGGIAQYTYRSVGPTELRYQLTQGQIICEDVPSGTTRSLQPGEQQAVGNVTIIVCGTASTQFASNYPTPSLERRVSVPQSQFSLQIKRRVMSLTDGTHLTANEIPGLESQRSDGVVAEVSHNRQDPTVLGLKNCSYHPWMATLTSGKQRQIDSDRSIKLAVGTKINFGSVEGEIRQRVIYFDFKV